MAKLKVEKIAVDARGMAPGYVGLGCVVGADRFHVWIHEKTGKLEDPIVYKNSVAQHRTEGYYDTRKLSSERGQGREVLEAMLPAFRSALKKFHAEEVEQELREKEAFRAMARDKRIRDAAPELLEALEALLAIPVCTGHLPHIDQQRARKLGHDAISKIEGRAR